MTELQELKLAYAECNRQRDELLCKLKHLAREEQPAQPLTEEENSKLFDLLIEEMLAHSYQGSHDSAEKVANEIRRMYKAALREALAEQPVATLYGSLPVYDKPAQQDIPDLIAGALGVSRGTAYDMMREALAEQSAREWVNLTVDELIDLEHKHLRHEDLAQAIEAKLKEKNT